MTALLWTLIGFFSGSLMFSYWIGRYVLRKDLQNVGDGNPGATNVLKAGGKAWGAFALLLDLLKGVLPVGIAHHIVGVSGWELVPVAIAPVIGHAFSPWMRFQGGKAMAVTGGVWIGLTLWEIPLVGSIALIAWFNIVAISGWAVLFTFTSMLGYLLLVRPDPVLLVCGLINSVIVLYKYRADLRQPLAFRPWLMRRLNRTPAP